MSSLLYSGWGREARFPINRSDASSTCEREREGVKVEGVQVFFFCFGVAPALVWLAGFFLASPGFLAFWLLGCLASWLLGFSAFGGNIEKCCISLLPLLLMRLLATRAMNP